MYVNKKLTMFCFQLFLTSALPLYWAKLYSVIYSMLKTRLSIIRYKYISCLLLEGALPFHLKSDQVNLTKLHISSLFRRGQFLMVTCVPVYHVTTYFNIFVYTL